VGDVTISEGDGQVTIRLERILRHPVDSVWSALTDPQADWTQGTEIDPRPDGRLVTHHASGDRVGYRIVRVQPRTIAEQTSSIRLSVSAVLKWHLTQVENCCLIVLLYRFESDETRDMSHSAAGWQNVIDRLEAQLDRHSIPGPSLDRPGFPGSSRP
jgi:uncharacterized protein YndB with AHSA1/START domain